MTPLEVGGLSLTVVDTAAGPRLSCDGETEGIAVAANAYLDGLAPEVLEVLRSRGSVGRGWLVVESCDPSDAAAQLEPWHRLSGQANDADPVAVGIPGHRGGIFYLPRAVMIEILERLAQRA